MNRSSVAGRFRNRGTVAGVTLLAALLLIASGAGFAIYLGPAHDLPAIGPLRKQDPTNTSLMRLRAAELRERGRLGGLGAVGEPAELAERDDLRDPGGRDEPGGLAQMRALRGPRGRDEPGGRSELGAVDQPAELGERGKADELGERTEPGGPGESGGTAGTGALFAENPFDIEWTDIGSISPILACSIVKSEDTNFFEHDGFAWQELARAAVRYVLGGFGGGSTITQQLAKNLFLGPEIALRRKLREALITWRIERTLSKRRILEIYLNVVEWGDGVWGISAASRHYFGKSPAQLDAFEAVFLTSLVPAPLEPFTGWNLDRFQESNRRVLDRIYYSGLISGAEWAEARSRLEALHASLVNGRSALESLPASASANGALLPPIRYQASPLPLSAALAESCGRERQRAEEAMRRRADEELWRHADAGEPHGAGDLLGKFAVAQRAAMT